MALPTPDTHCAIVLRKVEMTNTKKLTCKDNQNLEIVSV